MTSQTGGMTLGRHSHRWRRPLLLAVCLMCLAPTPGDIGGCGQAAELLGARQFFQKKRELDCRACTKCGVESRLCDGACDAEAEPDTEFAHACFPLVHDGEVCLRALRYSSCAEYETYLQDEQPQTPTECNFCPPKDPSQLDEPDETPPEPGTGRDGGR